jgi:hypothetical protein
MFRESGLLPADADRPDRPNHGTNAANTDRSDRPNHGTNAADTDRSDRPDHGTNAADTDRPDGSEDRHARIRHSVPVQGGGIAPVSVAHRGCYKCGQRNSGNRERERADCTVELGPDLHGVSSLWLTAERGVLPHAGVSL